MSTESSNSCSAIDVGAEDHPLNWNRTNRHEDPADRGHTKLLQAEALATLLYADCGEEFRRLNDAVQDRVHWLMADLITEAREALEQAQRNESARRCA